MMNDAIIQIFPELKSLVDDHITMAVDAEKRQQYAEARRNQAYWTANQYVVPTMFDNQIVDYRSATGEQKFGQTSAVGAYDYVRNQIRGDGRKFVAVLGNRAPNVKAIADHLDEDASVRKTKKANKGLGTLRAKWDVERVQRRLSFDLWLRGTTFGHVRWVTNGAKNGFVEEPVIENVPETSPGGFQCSACGQQSPDMGMCPCGKFLQPNEALPPQTVQIPKQTSVKRYPKGFPELSLETILRMTTPFYGDDTTNIPWAWLEYEAHQAIILNAYNDGNHEYAMQKLVEMRDKSSEAIGSNALSSTGRAARDSASSMQGTYQAPRRDRWSFSQFWLTPSMYLYIRDSQIQNALAEAFPNGLKVTQVEGEIIDVQDCTLEHELSACFTEPNESMFPDPICKDYMGAQDLINDVLNISVETAERAIGFTLFDPTVLNKKQFKDNPASPGEMIPAVAGVGKRLQDSMWAAPRPTLAPELLQWQETLVAWARENAGIMPALFGGEGPVQTAYQASRQLNQALMQLSPVWNEMRSFWKHTYMNGLRQLVEFDPDYRDLDFDGWHIEVEEAIPMSWGQIRDFFAMLLDKGPEAWQMFGLNDPINLATVHTAMGLEGWANPARDMRDHILDTVHKLLKEQPIVQPPMPGAPPRPLQASIMPDDLEFDPPLVIQVVKEWRQGEEAAQAQETNQEGFANVLAWARSYAVLMQPPPAPPGPGGPGEPPPPGGPPGAAGTPGGEPMPQGAKDILGSVPPPPPSVGRAPMPGPNTPLPQQ